MERPLSDLDEPNLLQRGDETGEHIGIRPPRINTN